MFNTFWGQRCSSWLLWWLFVRSISWICVPYTAPHNGLLIAIDGRWRQITSQGKLYIQQPGKETHEASLVIQLLLWSYFGNFYEKKFPTPPSCCRQHLISGRKRQSQHVLFSHYPWKFAKEKTWQKVFLKPMKIYSSFGISRLEDIVSSPKLGLKLYKREEKCKVYTHDCGCHKNTNNLSFRYHSKSNRNMFVAICAQITLVEGICSIPQFPKPRIKNIYLKKEALRWAMAFLYSLRTLPSEAWHLLPPTYLQRPLLILC